MLWCAIILTSYLLQAAYDAAQLELDKKKESLLACDKTISKLLNEKDKISKQISEHGLEIQKIEHKIQRHHKDKEDAQNFVIHLENKYSWIAAEKQYVLRTNNTIELISLFSF